MALITFYIVPERSFRLEKKSKSGTYTNQCLTVAERGNDKLFGKSCTPSSNMRWITTMRGGNKFQLMNVMTLQCIEFLQEKSLCESRERKLIGKVAMKQCNKNDGQYIFGRRDYIQTRFSRLCTTIYFNFYLRLKTEQNSSGEYPAFSQTNKQDSWLGLRWENVTYRGECHECMQNEVSEHTANVNDLHSFPLYYEKYSANCRLDKFKSTTLIICCGQRNNTCPNNP